MLEAVRRIIKQYNMLDAGDKVVCGVSGGSDSMALLHVLQSLQGEFGHAVLAAHLDHGLRPESAAEAAFVQSYCTAHDIPFFFEKADIAGIAKREHISKEEAGRRVRYNLFNRIAQEQCAAKIAVGHQLQDNAETVLFNLMRGSGLGGLGGIRPVQGNLIRPLLFIERDEILQYLKDHDIPFVRDESNESEEYTRNRIRHKLIPMMQQYNPNLCKTLSRMANMLAEDEEALRGMTDSYYRKAASHAEGGSIRLSLKELVSAPKAISRRIIRKAVESICGLKDLTGVQVDAVLELSALQPGSQADIHDGLVARRGFEDITILMPNLLNPHREIPLRLEGETGATDFGCRFVCTLIQEIPADLKNHNLLYEYFDADLFPQDAIIRSRREGDRIKPLGCGHMKLKKYLSEKKIPRWDREDIPVIALGQDILWAVGCGINDDVKVCKDTKRIMRIDYFKI